ncbi:hypothetical protein A2V49_02440 [candidate division WWE3 bacterium RBG_19FT_COMBO_34_6]|uniref:Oligoendopeptidase F n=1 Tax=candidate division WWE3 bacterium RBG_19FT_COMBO_34_6 TaxID=1802612 RepID=A0A1F4ULR1_UNCKA|nr:MAG: hypothetical protein A2V49_02440 [candidate division WWE3 bacterium RBG_19FT_COMBO_34_6]
MPITSTKRHMWDLNKLYKDDSDPNIAKDQDIIYRKSYEFINKWKDRTDYLIDAKILKNALDEYEYWAKEYGLSGKIGYYFSLKISLDQANPRYKAMTNKLHEFEVKILNDIQFFHLNLAKISPDKQEEFLNELVLENYRHFLFKIFEQAKYLLSEKEERIMNEKEKVASGNWIRLISELISKQQKITLSEDGNKKKHSFAILLTLISNKNKKIRSDAAKAVENILEKYLEIAEAEINSILENKKINDNIRGFKRADQARLMADDIDSNVVDNLVSAVSENFNLSKDYYDFKAKLLGQESLEYYERSADCFEETRKFSYEETVELVSDALRNIDNRMFDIFNDFVKGGHFDVFPQKNKMEGAFCAHSRLKDPTYILLNHTGKFEDVLTLAHEVGHGINNELIKQKQNELNFGTPTSTAEVASTLVEDLVMEKILEKADEKEKLNLIMKKLDMDITTIFRQTAFYNFEKELHSEFAQKGFLECKYIGELFSNHMNSYMGSASKGCENWWIYVSHFRDFFYVYSYVSGLLISRSMQTKLLLNADFIDNINDFLSAGLSDSPDNLFNKMSIDISKKDFWYAGLKTTQELFNEAKFLAKKIGRV